MNASRRLAQISSTLIRTQRFRPIINNPTAIPPLFKMASNMTAIPPLFTMASNMTAINSKDAAPRK